MYYWNIFFEFDLWEGFIFRPFWDSSESLPRSNWRALIIELRVEEARQADRRVEEILRGTKQDYYWNDSYI